MLEAQMDKIYRVIRLTVISTVLSLASGCNVELPPDTQDAIDILSTLAKIDLSNATNLVIADTPDGVHSLLKEDSSGVLIQVNFLDTQNQSVDTSDVFPVAMRLLNSEYLYLVLGSEAGYQPSPDPFSDPNEFYEFFEYINNSTYLTGTYYKKQRHFLVRLTDGAMFRFNARDFALELGSRGAGIYEPALFGKYSLYVNDNNIYFSANYNGLYKLDTGDPNNLTATRISFIDDVEGYYFIVNKDSQYLYSARTEVSNAQSDITRYSTPSDTGYVTLTDDAGDKFNFSGLTFICPDDTIYSGAYTIDTSTADVASQVPPTLNQISPNPWSYTKDGGTAYIQASLRDNYTFYNVDGTHRSTLLVSNEGDVWKICGGSGPSRLSSGGGNLIKHMSSNGKLYIFSSNGLSNELHAFDPVTESDTTITSSCTTCVWTDFRVNGVDDITLYGSNAATATTNLIHRIYADGTEEELSADTDVSEVYQVERFF